MQLLKMTRKETACEITLLKNESMLEQKRIISEKYMKNAIRQLLWKSCPILMLIDTLTKNN